MLPLWRCRCQFDAERKRAANQGSAASAPQFPSRLLKKASAKRRASLAQDFFSSLLEQPRRLDADDLIGADDEVLMQGDAEAGE